MTNVTILKTRARNIIDTWTAQFLAALVLTAHVHGFNAEPAVSNNVDRIFPLLDNTWKNSLSSSATKELSASMNCTVNVKKKLSNVPKNQLYRPTNHLSRTRKIS